MLPNITLQRIPFRRGINLRDFSIQNRETARKPHRLCSATKKASPRAISFANLGGFELQPVPWNNNAVGFAQFRLQATVTLDPAHFSRFLLA
jgi:hypothetical protein